MCKVVTSGTLVTKDLAPSRGKRESNLGIENTCRSKTHDGTDILKENAAGIAGFLKREREGEQISYISTQDPDASGYILLSLRRK